MQKSKVNNQETLVFQKKLEKYLNFIKGQIKYSLDKDSDSFLMHLDVK